MQGWVFGHPVPAAEFRKLLEDDVRKAEISAEVPEESDCRMPLRVA
jgi:hypothetical protein